MTQRNFTDADLEALMDFFWRKIQQEVGSGILKGLWTSLIGVVIGACALGLAIKMKLVPMS
jgi:hypothetical protein